MSQYEPLGMAIVVLIGHSLEVIVADFDGTTIQHFKVKNKIKTETKIRYNQTHTRHRRTKSGVKFGVWLALRVERNLHYNTFKKETIQSTEEMHQTWR